LAGLCNTRSCENIHRQTPSISPVLQKCVYLLFRHGDIMDKGLAHLCGKSTGGRQHMTKEEQFYQALEGIFIGAPVEGESGYINLMRIKSRYYRTGVFPQLQKDIEETLKPFPDFRDELFLKLYTFFKRYFSKSGSIYFDSTPADQNIYEKVYTDDRDVMLFWKTHMLYYVKTDRLFKPLDTEIDGFKFHFDVSTLKHKQANEKRDIVYDIKEIKDDVLVFNVYYSEKGKKTGTDDILKALTKAKVKITEDTLEKAFRIFEKQSEVDYFINKNARAFLKEQFDLWLYQYVLSGESQWTETRIKQLQVLKDMAYKIIDFISQFEDELVRIWNKPKFALNSNYVITLDRIADKDINLISTLLKHPGFNEQVAEWKQLGIVNDVFDSSTIMTGGKKSPTLNPKYAHLPIDTKYFKDLELNIVGLFDDLDNALDGWLIKSENYQALNTILPKFKERVQTIYIDPPFNKEQDADYFYSVKYKDSSWITILENRLWLAKDILEDGGSIFVRCDYNGNMYARLLLSRIFGITNLRNELIVKRGKIQFGESNKYTVATDSLFLCSKTDNYYFEKFRRPRYSHEPKGSNMILRGERFPRERVFCDASGRLHTLLPPTNTHFKFIQTTIDEMTNKGLITLNTSRKKLDSGFMKLINGHWEKTELVPAYKFDVNKALDSNWTDISGYSQDWDFPTENSEKLLHRVIKTSSVYSEIVLDFFLGSGTTAAVAHKLRRKWIGVEMQDHFYSTVLPRMKEVLAGRGNHEPCGISKEVSWQGGGFFKYYELEQYEDTLRNVKYKDSDLFDSTSQDPYSQYVFMKDLKMLEALEIDYENNKVEVDLQKLYPNINIPETLSNLLEKYIKKIKPNEVEFEDGEKISLNNLDYKLIKPLIWW
jgi:adenine specific DNA methylase Mod